MYRFAFELQRRRVSRSAISYALLVWLNVQVADVFFPMAGLPEWTLRLVVIIGLLGLPLVVFLAWTFQITPHGVRVDDGGETAVSREARHANRVELILSVLLLVLGVALAGWLLTDRVLADDGPVQREPREAAANEVFIALAFHTSGPESAMGLERALQARLRHELIRLPNVTVIADAASGVPGTAPTTAGGLLVSGTLSLEGGRVHAFLDALDLRTRHYVWTAAFDYAGDSLVEAEVALTDRVLTEIKHLLGTAEPAARPAMHQIGLRA